MKKLITFSLWGEDPKYCTGAIRNAELAKTIYPGWICRFYFGTTPAPTPDTPIGGLLGRTIFKLMQMDNVECVFLTEPADWTGMFWRFYPASEDDVEVFISRDCDSRLSEREAVAVQEWLDGPWFIHSMRDHPEHTVPLLGGMWGCKHGAIPDMKELIDKWNKEDRWQTDQDFLKHVIWPKHYYRAIVHDDWNRFPMMGLEQRSFPTQRQGNDFIGSIIGPNEERLHPEHHSRIG